jgi:hypothetical protein
VQLNSEELTSLQNMLDSHQWDRFETILQREAEKAINNLLKSTDERQIGRLALIREMLALKKAMKDKRNNVHAG